MSCPTTTAHSGLKTLGYPKGKWRSVVCWLGLITVACLKCSIQLKALLQLFLTKTLSRPRSYHKTESVIKTTAEKTSSLFSGFTSKLSQMKNSESYKSFEGKVGGAYESVKVTFFNLEGFFKIRSFNNFRQRWRLHVPDPCRVSMT